MKGFATFAIACMLPITAVDAQAPLRDYTNSGVARGSWAYRPLVGGSEARFMDATGTIRLTLGCARTTRQVTIARASAAPAATLLIWTSSHVRNLSSRFEQNPVRVSARTTAYDPLLDAIAFSRGRFAVSMPGSTPLIVSAAPEVARVVEDCRA